MTGCPDELERYCQKNNLNVEIVRQRSGKGTGQITELLFVVKKI